MFYSYVAINCKWGVTHTYSSQDFEKGFDIDNIEISVLSPRMQFRNSLCTDPMESEPERDFSVGMNPINVGSPDFDLDTSVRDFGLDAEFLDRVLE